jgi:hypothetical protein
MIIVKTKPNIYRPSIPGVIQKERTMTHNRILRYWLMVVFVLFAVSFTTACAPYPGGYYDSSTGTYYRSDRCRIVNRVVTDNGVVVRDSTRLVCSGPSPYHDYYYNR